MSWKPLLFHINLIGLVMGACCRVACVGQVASYMVSDSEEVSLLGTACMGFRHCPMEGVLGSVHMEVMACAVVVVSLL